MLSLKSFALRSRKLPLVGGKLADLTLSRNVSAANVARLLKAFREISSILPRIDREIAAQYSACTEVLDPLSGASDELVAESESLLRLAVGQTDGDLMTEGTGKLLEEPVQFLKDWRTEVMSGLAQLETCGDVLSDLQGSEGLLQTLVSPLHYMQVMFRVEAARLAEDVRQVFADLTEQIVLVHKEVSTTFGEQFQIVGSTIKTLDGITRGIRQQANTLESDLRNREASISNSLLALHHELEKNSARDVALSSTSHCVSAALGELVVALQSQDITTQRIHHILSGIREAEVSIATQGPTKAEAGARAYYLLAVQRAQLSGVHEELEKSERALVAALNAIDHSTESLTSDCLVLSEFKEVTVGVNGSIQVSIDMLVDLRHLLEAVVDCSNQFYRSIEPVSHLTTSLSGALERLSNKMRLIALNAQVQAVQIGAGTGLEVLAAQIALVSRQTSALAENISGNINRLVTTIQALSLTLRRIAETGAKHLHGLRTEGGEHECRLHGVRDRTLNKLSVVGAASDRIRSLVAGIQQENDSRARLLDALKQAETKLGNELSALSTAFNGRAVLRSEQPTSYRYSMQSEHQAHTDAVEHLNSLFESESSNPSTPAQPEASGEAQPESFIELF